MIGFIFGKLFKWIFRAVVEEITAILFLNWIIKKPVPPILVPLVF